MKVTNLASFYYLPDKEQLQYIRAMRMTLINDAFHIAWKAFF